MRDILAFLKDFFTSIFARPSYDQDPKTLPMNLEPEVTDPRFDVTTIYPNWADPEIARHNLRVICDQEGLTVAQKNLTSQVVHCESGYHVHATHPNLYKGKQVSCDFGICQWNDHYHGTEISPDEAMNNPEKAIRLMCQYVKAGKITQWVCYSSKLYLQYTP